MLKVKLERKLITAEKKLILLESAVKDRDKDVKWLEDVSYRCKKEKAELEDKNKSLESNVKDLMSAVASWKEKADELKVGVMQKDAVIQSLETDIFHIMATLKVALNEKA